MLAGEEGEDRGLDRRLAFEQVGGEVLAHGLDLGQQVVLVHVGVPFNDVGFS